VSVLSRWLKPSSKPVDIPPSEETLALFRQSKRLNATLTLRRSLRGSDYSDSEIEAIVGVFVEFLDEKRDPRPDEVRERLVARGLAPSDAEIFAQAVAQT